MRSQILIDSPNHATFSLRVNDVSQLPPELLRKGRWDELFFVDLPTREEREAIWQIQIAKFHRVAPSFDLRQLAKVTDAFTGSEIEQVFIEALYRAFEQEQEPTDLTIGEVLVDFVPLSKLMLADPEGNGPGHLDHNL